MSKTPPTISHFNELNLPEPLLESLSEVGYETPTPIQAQAIPILLNGEDLLGHAPTGTGKTAAFALPTMARINVKDKVVQVLVLTPTRELAIQVAEAFQRYACRIPGFHVLPIYGGQPMTTQTGPLKRGVHVVVGTPGRVMDHMRRGTLKLGGLRTLVLDEADEMLKMGFIDDVEWVLEQIPDKRQMALFSATMPEEIQRIARKHMNDAKSIAIKALTATAVTIRQRYWLVSGMRKLDALTRILEVEDFDGMIIFARTRIATTGLAEKLQARGFSAAALNGDMAQKERELIVDRLKRGKLDILVATDVAARGLDVDRISHVVNFDIPHDTEAYIHRIGRTGRAGRQGEAILFVAPRERRMLKAIEKAARTDIPPLELPTTETVNNKRIADFKQSITDMLGRGELDFMQNILEQYQQEHDVPALEIAAALAKLSIGDEPLLLSPDRPARPVREFNDRPSKGGKHGKPKRSDRKSNPQNMETYRIDVGHNDKVMPGNIVGAITNESGLEGHYIGQINIQNHFSLVDLPAGIPGEILDALKDVRVRGKRMNITKDTGGPGGSRNDYSSTKPAYARKKQPSKKAAPPKRKHEKAKAKPKPKPGKPKPSAKPRAANPESKTGKRSTGKVPFPGAQSGPKGKPGRKSRK